MCVCACARVQACRILASSLYSFGMELRFNITIQEQWNCRHLPKDYHLVEAHVTDGEVCKLDPLSYAGGSVRSWQDHQSQTGQKVGARLSVVHWSSRLQIGRGANNSTP